MKNNCHIKKEQDRIVIEAIKGDEWHTVEFQEGTDIYKSLEKLLELAS